MWRKSGLWFEVARVAPEQIWFWPFCFFYPSISISWFLFLCFCCFVAYTHQEKDISYGHFILPRWYQESRSWALKAVTCWGCQLEGCLTGQRAIQRESYCELSQQWHQHLCQRNAFPSLEETGCASHAKQWWVMRFGRQACLRLSWSLKSPSTQRMWQWRSVSLFARTVSHFYLDARRLLRQWRIKILEGAES